MIIYQIISMIEANQNFSKASKTSDKYAEAIIMKNNKSKYVLVDIENYMALTEDEKIEIVAKRVLEKPINAFKELAK